jgi:hypothetical protein
MQASSLTDKYGTSIETDMYDGGMYLDVTDTDGKNQATLCVSIADLKEWIDDLEAFQEKWEIKSI